MRNEAEHDVDIRERARKETGSGAGKQCARERVRQGLSKTGICSRQDAKNAKSGSLISLRPHGPPENLQLLGLLPSFL
jgi:hypothetical protein